MKWSKKKVLVTGGAGFLGLSLAKRLCSDASTVTILDNFSSGGRKAVESLPAKIIEGNVTDGASLGRVDDVDYIFHMGSPSSITLFNSNPQVCFRETTEGW